MARLSLRAYARRRGVSHTAVRKAVARNRITVGPDGKLDPEVADRQWQENTDPAQAALRGRRTSNMQPQSDQANEAFARARAVREHYLARLAQLEFEERRAQLLEVNEVRVVSHRIDQAFREHMLRVPDSVVARLRAHVREHGAAPCEHQVHVILAGEIRAALESFADAIVSGGL